MTVRCFDLLGRIGTTGCLALAILNAEGIPAACEGDRENPGNYIETPVLYVETKSLAPLAESKKKAGSDEREERTKNHDGHQIYSSCGEHLRNRADNPPADGGGKRERRAAPIVVELHFPTLCKSAPRRN